MAGEVTFLLGQGGLGRALPGQEFVSGLVCYIPDADLPAGFSTSDRIKTVYQIEDAEALGIVGDFSDETPSEASYEVTAIGANGDRILVEVTEYEKTVTLCSYVKTSGDSTVNLLAASIGAAINALTYVHGYSATVSTDVVTIVARKGLGVYLDNATTPLKVTITGTVTGTITQFDGGEYSELALIHYHVSEFFRMQPQGKLYIGLFDVPNTFDGAEVSEMQIFTEGEIRQIGIYYKGDQFDVSYINSIQEVCDDMFSQQMPLIVIMGADIVGLSLSALTDLSLRSCKDVSLCISQDGKNLGYRLFKASGVSVTTLGNVLGCVALSSDSENIGWRAKFNVSDGTENDTAAYANGVALKSVSANLQDQLNRYSYIQFVKNVGQVGTWYKDSPTCVARNSDYAYIENVRTIYAVIRGLYRDVFPFISGKITLNADGTMTDTYVANLETACENNLSQMVRDEDLAGTPDQPGFRVSIDPAQNVLSTSLIEISVMVVPQGVARQIKFKVGFTTKV